MLIQGKRILPICHFLTHTSSLPEYEQFVSLITKETDRMFTNGNNIPALQLCLYI
jgi:hypothetical protein